MMSFGGGWAPPNPWHNSANLDPNSWRPYANNQGGGAMRPQHYSNQRNGWVDVLSNPYFSRNTSYDRNRMNSFNQPQPPMRRPAPLLGQRPLRKPLLESPMNEYARQTLMNNAHVPGLRTGLQMRDAMQQRVTVREQAQKKIINVALLKVTLTVSSEKIELRWQHPTPRRDVKYTVHTQHLKSKKITTIDKPSTSFTCDVQVVAGDTYKIDVVCRTLQGDFVIANWSKEIRAEFSYSELKRLLQKCQSFVRRGINSEPQMHEFCVLYRCKPKVYWDEIHHYCNDVMQKYIKDNNGQPGNLINGKINGLFFSARLLPDLTLPPCSPFGNVRMIINAFILLNPARHNFYFADFYCNKNIHYVTVVICVIDSETDRFCRERLIKLNPLSNPFVKLVPPMDPFGQWRFYVNYTLWVEIYFTEDIQLDIGQFSAIMATGAGTSKIGGLPNNKSCNMCNLYPVGKKKQLITVEAAEQEVNNLDSTMATILREDRQVDSEVAETLGYIIDRVEERCMTSEELAEKLDADLITAVEDMNKAVGRDKTNSLASIAKNLNDFMSSFNKRRDVLIQEVQKMKSEKKEKEKEMEKNKEKEKEKEIEKNKEKDNNDK